MSREHNKPLAFEEYLYFYREPTCEDLNIKQLKQILFIHGLEKLSNHSKEEITGAVRSMRLISPTRSTFNISRAQLIPSGAESEPSIQEVKQDIGDLAWQECPVGSIVTVGPAALGMVGCGTADDSFSLTNSLIVPLRPDKERGGVDGKRFRINKKKENTPLFSSKLVEKPHKNSLELKQEATKAIQVPIPKLKDIDDHHWTNKGYSTLKGCLFPRMYYKCKGPGCSVMKYVDRDPVDPSMCIVTYKGEHVH